MRLKKEVSKQERLDATKLLGKKVAVVRIRGLVNNSKAEESTMKMLNLHNKFYCSVITLNQAYLGMLNKVKHLVTFGEIDDTTLKALIEKRQEKNPDGSPKKFFRLHPPRKGFERKGTKRSYSEGGAYGYRGAKINELIMRML